MTRCLALHCTTQHFDPLSRAPHTEIVSRIFIGHQLSEIRTHGCVLLPICHMSCLCCKLLALHQKQHPGSCKCNTAKLFQKPGFHPKTEKRAVKAGIKRLWWPSIKLCRPGELLCYVTNNKRTQTFAVKVKATRQHHGSSYLSYNTICSQYLLLPNWCAVESTRGQSIRVHKP